jgi:hypothetical protein
MPWLGSSRRVSPPRVREGAISVLSQKFARSNCRDSANCRRDPRHITRPKLDENPARFLKGGGEAEGLVKIAQVGGLALVPPAVGAVRDVISRPIRAENAVHPVVAVVAGEDAPRIGAGQKVRGGVVGIASKPRREPGRAGEGASQAGLPPSGQR